MANEPTTILTAPKLTDEQRNAIYHCAEFIAAGGEEGKPKLAEYVESLLLETVSNTRKELQAEQDQFRRELTEKLQEANAEALRKFEEDFKKANTPPSQDEIRSMLDAEYLEFPVKVKLSNKLEEITLSELPGSVERKFLHLLRDKFQGRVKEFSKLLLEVAAETDDNSKFFAFWRAVDPIAELLESTVALVLSHNLKREVTAQEVADSMTFDRQLVIVRAQMECNRVRDFFSHVFQLMNR